MRLDLARAVGLLAVASLIAGCDPPERSDGGLWSFRVDLVDRLGFDSKRVLVGSSFEIAPAWSEAVIDDNVLDLDDCVGYAAAGSLSFDGERFVVAEPGLGTAELLAPLSLCPTLQGALAEQAADSWSLLGVEAEQVEARWRSSADNDVFIWKASPGPAGAFPPSLGVPLDRVRVVADGRFLLTPVLVQPSVDPRQEVRFTAHAETLVLPGHYAHLEAVSDDPETGPLGRLEGSIPAGARFDASLRVAGHDFALPPVEAVAVGEIASIELIPAYLSNAGARPSDVAEREWGSPVGVLALTRDAEGRRIVGAPIEWSLTRGTLSVETLDPGDALALGDVCRPSPDEPELRGATVEATIAEVHASVDLEWIALPGHVLNPIRDDVSCVGTSCNCSSDADPRGSFWAALGLLGLGLARRRRYRSRPKAARS